MIALSSPTLALASDDTAHHAAAVPDPGYRATSDRAVRVPTSTDEARAAAAAARAEQAKEAELAKLVELLKAERQSACAQR